MPRQRILGGEIGIKNKNDMGNKNYSQCGITEPYEGTSGCGQYTGTLRSMKLSLKRLSIWTTEVSDEHGNLIGLGIIDGNMFRVYKDGEERLTIEAKHLPVDIRKKKPPQK